MEDPVKPDPAMLKLSGKIGALLDAEIRRRQKTLSSSSECFTRLFMCLAANLGALIDQFGKTVEDREAIDRYVLESFAENRRLVAEKTRDAERVEQAVEQAMATARAGMSSTTTH